MRVRHWWLIAMLGAAATAVSLLLTSAECPPPSFALADATPSSRVAHDGVAYVPGGMAMASSWRRPEREVASGLRGRVVDVRRRPVAEIPVTMQGRAERAISAEDGAFEFTGEGGPVRAVPGPGWLCIDTPLLELCGNEPGTLIVAAAASLQGRVVDDQGAAVPGADLAVEVDVSLPAGGGMHSLQLCLGWTAESNADGWFVLPHAPIGDAARLVVRHEGFATTAQPLDGDPLRYLHVQLAPIVPVSGHDASPPHRTNIAGRLLVGDIASCGDWWVSVRSITEEGEHGAMATRTDDGLPSVPVRVGADGRFALAGVPEGRCVVEAWDGANLRVARSATIEVPAADVTLDAMSSPLPERIVGRVVDANGAPVAGVAVGLARPSAWSVHGASALYAEAQATTDARGHFDLQTHGVAALELRVAGPNVLPTRVSLPSPGAPWPAVLELRAERRRWLRLTNREAGPSGDLVGAEVEAIDHAGTPLLLWTEVDARPRASCHLADSMVFGALDAVHTLVVRAGERELGRIRLSGNPHLR